MNQLILDFAQNKSYILRKAFISLCEGAIKTISRKNFISWFMKAYMELSRDSIKAVKLEFVKSLQIIKPYFDYDMDTNVKFLDLINELRNGN